MPTFRNTVSSIFVGGVNPAYTTYEDETACSETSSHKISTPGITQKKEYSIQNTTKV
jgi:hypothetical protein